MSDLKVILSLGISVKLSAREVNGLCQELTDNQKRISELEEALLSTNKELYVVLCEINSELAENAHPLSESEPHFRDMQTVYDNQVLLKGGAK